MAKLVPVNYDPFATTNGKKLVPVEGNPFESVSVGDQNSGGEFARNNPNVAAAIDAGGAVVKSVGTSLSNAPASMLNYLKGSVEGLQAIPQIVSDPTTYGPLMYEALKEQYGQLAQPGEFQRQFEQDPANLLSLISLPVTVAGGGVQGIGKLLGSGKTLQAGKYLTQVGDYLEPLNAAINTPRIPGIKQSLQGVKKGLDTVIDTSLGEGTLGVGAEAVRVAREEPTKIFKDAMRGKISSREIIDMAKEKISGLANKRRQDYQDRLGVFKSSTNPVDFNGAKQNLADNFSSFGVTLDPQTGKMNFGGTNITDGSDVAAIRKAYTDIQNWSDPSPAKAEILKQRLEGFEAQAGTAKGKKIIGDARRQLQADIEASLGDDVAKSNYRAMNEEYGRLQNLQDELVSTLSLEAGKNRDTAIKKLMSTMRGNFRGRGEVLRDLVGEGFDLKELNQALAGYSMQDLQSKALFGKGAQYAGGIKLVTDFFAGTANPAVFGLLLTSSPRVVGEMLSAMSFGSRDISQFLAQRPKLKRVADMYSQYGAVPARQGRNVMYQTGEAMEGNK